MTWNELVLRFVLGGSMVSAFSILGGAWKPKTLAGIFASAPAVALGTLVLACVQKPASYAATEARSMVLGALALGAYSSACIAVVKNDAIPVWLGALLSWSVWFAVAAVLFGLGLWLGVRL